MSDGDLPLERLIAGVNASDPMLEQHALHAAKQALLGISAPAPSHRLGRYVLDRRLGRGSAGTVYVARDPRLGRDVAVKLLQSADDSEAQRDRLMHEARTLARLSHPNIVVVHDVGIVEPADASVSRPGSVFIVMELLEGTTLGHWLNARPRSSSAILGAFADAGRGLAAAHRAGVLHRDFKAHNVMVTTGGKVKVVDFGLARGLYSAESSLHGSPRPEAPALRGVTSVAGTPLYMAPELTTGTPADARSDQYSFAVSLWRALTGEDPFPGAGWDAMLAAKRRGPPSGDPRVARGVALALRRAMDPEPGRRYPDMESLLGALAIHVKRRRWALVTAAGLAVGAGIVGWTTMGAACPPPSMQWTEAERHQARGMFVHSEVADAELRFARVDATLVWAETALQDVGARVCDAAGPAACLRRERAHHQVLIDTVLEADRRVIDRSDDLLEGLGDPHDCEGASWPAEAAALDTSEFKDLVAHLLHPGAPSRAQARARAEAWARQERWSLAAKWQRRACRTGAPSLDDVQADCLRSSELALRSEQTGALVAAWLRYAQVLDEHGQNAQARLLLDLARPRLAAASPAQIHLATRLRASLDAQEPRP